MCFSPEADLVTGIVVSGVGIDALRRAPDRRFLPLAALPLLLGLHQVIEAFGWWGMRGDLPRQVGDVAIWLYLAIALVVVPAVVPAAFRAGESDPGRRGRMFPFVLLGAVVAAALLPGLLNSGAGGEVACRYIAYDSGVDYGGYVLPFYVTATCMPMLLSSSRRLVLFGLANLIVVALLGWLLARGVISLWCVWAAVSSVVFDLEVRAAARSPSRSATAPV
ncbi:MAG: hypothetical protein JW785_00510 [Acidimicrobiia bacterium]|nr:hypothetical protein [Acidimicrobiia bacterium]